MKCSLALCFLSSSCWTVSICFASGGVLQYCNRGFCYTKKESSDLSLKRKSGLNFCTDSGGHVRDCELFEILGTGGEGDFEAIECKSSSCRRMQQEESKKEATSQIYSTVDGETMEFMDLDDKEQHISWKERPKRGRCYDNALAYEFDCNLVEILE